MSPNRTLSTGTLKYLQHLVVDGFDHREDCCGGGNFDDAYWGGFEDGQAFLAKDILASLKEYVD
jgi:hypothetical protein